MLKNKRESHYNPRVVEKPKKFIDPNKKIIAIDFDGTIVRNNYPYIENPDERLIAWIKSHRDKYTFILWTCRHGKQLKYALDWLKEQEIEFDLVNENPPHLIEKYGDTRKIFANYYIDDKGYKPDDFINNH